MGHRQVFSISSFIVLLCLFIEIDGRPQRTTTEVSIILVREKMHIYIYIKVASVYIRIHMNH